ncbi:putative tubulin polyglutamylase TTLL9, partial [Toxocara canis]
KKILWKCSLGNTILEVLNNREGWAQTTGEDWSLFWVTREWMNNCFDKYKFREHQLVCHFRNDCELTRKDMLVKNFKKAKRTLEKENPTEATKMHYIPASYVLPAEYHLFVEEFRKYPPDTIWIMKPVAGAQGKGIFLFRKLKDITEWKKGANSSDPQPYLVQSYISRPYLVASKKFDIRIYVLVTSFRPLRAWLHREGFARFSHSRYSLNSVEDAYVHLTNVAVAKTAPDYDPQRGLKWNVHKLRRYLTAMHGINAIEKLMDELGWIIICSLRSVQHLVIQDTHCFELYGYDILLDEKLKPWLLEVNASPSLTASSQEDFEMKYRILSHMLDVLDLEKKFRELFLTFTF